MKIKDWLKSSEQQLGKAGISSAHLDALILLEDVVKKERTRILANFDHTLSNTQLKRLESRVRKRANHLPLAYVRGHTEFYGRKFLVNRHTLEPRPESETMVELLLKLPVSTKVKIADVGTGSGAVGITASLELHNPNVDLYDIDASAIAVARHNLALHELHLHTRKSDLLRRHIRTYDVILANLPYVPDHYQINQAAAMEPKIAIFGGKDGLGVYRRFFTQLHRFSWNTNYVLCESLPNQHKDLELIAKQNGFRLFANEAFIQVFKSN
jgi:release factor glutamine methyltransferase